MKKGRPFNYKTQCFLIAIIIMNTEKGRPFSCHILYVMLNNRQHTYARKRDGPLTM